MLNASGCELPHGGRADIVYRPLVTLTVASETGSHPEQQTLDPSHAVDEIPLSTREHWMHRAIEVLIEHASSPCTFAAFGAVIVNHTDPTSLGELICEAINSAGRRGNPTLHGEMVAIHRCTEVLQGPQFGLGPAEAIAALRDLTLYTTAEPCPMCASAIRWAGFRECVYGTSIEKLVQLGWRQIGISSAEIIARSNDLGTRTTLREGVLQRETDPLFSWQFDQNAPCPEGCIRNDDGRCVEISSSALPYN